MSGKKYKYYDPDAMINDYRQGVPMSELSNISGSTAGAIGQLGVAGANALASGNMASANLMSGALGNVGNTALMYSLLKG
jgi:hypothetical protein